MKNIHLLPTDKPSRLHYYSNVTFGVSKEHLNWKQGRNIYITNSEQIKEGERGLSINDAVYTHFNHLGKDYGKKIILTTDQDLIKDGVQAIDDEFLEWFVKNPSCEKVEFQRWYDGYKFGYKIIIPQEKPKQNCENCKHPISKYGCACGKQKEEPKQERICNCGLKESEHNVRHPFIPRQETLEKATENSALKHFLFPKELFFKMCKCSQNDYLLEEEFGLDNTTKYREILGFIKGAKWQAERTYSEEDMIKFTEWCTKSNYVYYFNGLDWTWGNSRTQHYTTSKELLISWKEQFKKK
jgi:hypothetical protein